jgi:hypothetical protein
MRSFLIHNETFVPLTPRRGRVSHCLAPNLERNAFVNQPESRRLNESGNLPGSLVEAQTSPRSFG